MVTRYRSYLLRMWQEGSGWRFTLTSLDDDQRQVEFFRLPYDIDTVVNRIKDVPELSDWLGERLLEGR